MTKEPNVWRILGRNVKYIRMIKGIKSKDFAEQFGITVGRLKKLEAGAICGFSYYDIPKLKSILNVQDTELLKNIEYVND